MPRIVEHEWSNVCRISKICEIIVVTLCTRGKSPLRCLRREGDTPCVVIAGHSRDVYEIRYLGRATLRGIVLSCDECYFIVSLFSTLFLHLQQLVPLLLSLVWDLSLCGS